ncbi:MAG TPA: hypothetical protein VF221_05375 [Chloroflexota bacterium]
MSVPAQMLRLEQLDTEIEQAEASLNDLRRRRQHNPALQAAEARVRRLRDNEVASAAEQRRLEAELADIEAKMKRDNTRMYSGQIVDSRELASLERELAHYAAQRDELEGQVLEAMEHAEAFAGEIAASDESAQAERQRWEAEVPALERQEAELTDQLARLRAEREQLAAEVDPRTLSTYIQLRTGSGHGVSVVRDGICQWCRVTVPQKDVQHARSGALVVCSNCARILYVGS